jgi:colicin import membrane protein
MALKAPRSLIAASLAAGLALAMPVASFAQYSPTTAQPSPLVAPRKAVEEATKNYQAAQKQLVSAKEKLKAQFMAREDWSKTKKAADKSKREDEAAKTAAMAALDKRPDYKAAKAARDAAEQKMRSGEKMETAEMDRLAGEVMNNGLAMKKIEADYLANDQKYADAKAKYEQSQKEMSLLEGEVDAAAANDPECVAAQQAVDSSKQQLDQARTSLAQAAKADAEARAAAAKAKSSSAGGGGSAPRGSGGGTYGGHR